MLKVIYLTSVFVLELIMFFTYGYYGYTRKTGAISGILLSILLVSVAVILWGIFAAPKSAYRLHMPFVAVFRAAMFLSASFMMWQTGFKNYAIIMGVLAIISQVISFFYQE